MPIRVAIVENDSQTRSIVTDWINQAKDFQLVGEWGDAESAVEMLPKENPDVVLMDINLLEMSGIEAVSRLKPLLPDTQFVMLTVYEDADHIYDALASGATGYLLKQTPQEELFAALEDVHRGGSPMTASIARKVVQFFSHTPAGTPETEQLSTRELEILNLLARGYFFKEVAERLNINKSTVKTYVYRMYKKLHVRSRTQAVAKYAHLAKSD